MNVYKFGGASVKSADAVRNLLEIISLEEKKIFVVISAMNKTTNAFEELLKKMFNGEEYSDNLNEIFDFHTKIINQLFEDSSKIKVVVDAIFEEIKQKITTADKNNYDKTYDSIVSFGEILSTTIISHFFDTNGLKNQLVDARKIIKTDDYFREASVDFVLTIKNINEILNNSDKKIFITQGFIGSNSTGETTTLGREGSDYTASVIANIINANKIILWKDVAGIYNADPKLMKKITKLEKISYREATELAYFGAKVIHPKTAKPLMEKNIELCIQSFNNVKETGTSVKNYKDKIFPVVPIYIYNKNQTLVTLRATDFSFISEDFYEKVFSIFNKYKTKINLLQNSALNLSLCFDYNSNNFLYLLKELEQNFDTKYNQNLTLITIRHFNDKVLKRAIKNKKIIMQQRNRINAFFLVEDFD